MSGKSEVPEEAVEAARTATQEVCESYDPGGWAEDEQFASWARKILEAAAPFIAAKAQADIIGHLVEFMKSWAGDKEIGFMEGALEAARAAAVRGEA